MRTIEEVVNDFKTECIGREEIDALANEILEIHKAELERIDKIRTEIMQLDYDTESIDYDHNDMPQTEIVHTICREEVLHIINKIKEESEK